MANQSLFSTRVAATTDAVNAEGAPAYAFSAEHALAQYVMTGCLHGTFYAQAQEQLDQVLALCAAARPEFIARTAIYGREQGYMKDMPALLCACLSVREPQLMTVVFRRVIDNGKMLRNFVQIMRSGVVGRRSLGSAPKRLVREWLATRDDTRLFRESVGQSPSFGDIVRMVHPRPMTGERAALYAYFLGRVEDQDPASLPALVREYHEFRANGTGPLPDVPFVMLTSLNLTAEQWRTLALAMPWHATRMNLNTLARHRVFADDAVTAAVAKKLRERELILRARVFPYQLLAAYQTVDRAVPAQVRDALQDALEVATENVPALDCKVYVCPDVSASMMSPITGGRGSATSRVRCVDVAALIAATILRKNRAAEVLAFDTDIREVALNPRDSVMTNAARLAALGGGGTACSAPLVELNRREARGDLVVLVSDNESWVDARRTAQGTQLMAEWDRFRKRNPQARLVCLDLQPNRTTQAAERADILNIGGFSDQVFTVLSDFARGRLAEAHWAGEIERIVLG